MTDVNETEWWRYAWSGNSYENAWSGICAADCWTAAWALDKGSCPNCLTRLIGDILESWAATMVSVSQQAWIDLWAAESDHSGLLYWRQEVNNDTMRDIMPPIKSIYLELYKTYSILDTGKIYNSSDVIIRNDLKYFGVGNKWQNFTINKELQTSRLSYKSWTA